MTFHFLSLAYWLISYHTTRDLLYRFFLGYIISLPIECDVVELRL